MAIPCPGYAFGELEHLRSLDSGESFRITRNRGIRKRDALRISIELLVTDLALKVQTKVAHHRFIEILSDAGAGQTAEPKTKLADQPRSYPGGEPDAGILKCLRHTQSTGVWIGAGRIAVESLPGVPPHQVIVCRKPVI